MNGKSSTQLYLIDASIFIFRYYFSMPSNWQSNTGRPTETVYGYLQWLIRFLSELEPERVVVCFDESLTSCFRNQIYPNYKSSRVLPDDDLTFQLLACKRVTELLGLTCIASDRYEADDLIGSFSDYCRRKEKSCTILTRDKDLGQLVLSDNMQLWDFPDGDVLGYRQIEQKMGVLPEQIPDFLAIVGDVSDDIPGVPGIGKQTAVQLLSFFENWGDIKENIENIHMLPIRGASRVQEKIKEFSEQVDIYLQLSTIAVDAYKVSWKDTRVRDVDLANLFQLSEGLGFSNTINKKIEQLTIK